MPIRRILVPLDGVDTESIPFELGLELASTFSAHVDALHAGADPRESLTYLGDGMTSGMIHTVLDAAEADAKGRIQRSEAVFRKYCEKAQITVVEPKDASPEREGPSASYVRTVGKQAENIARHGQLCDVTVVARPQPEEDVLPPIALEAVLLETGRPVLVTPPAKPASWGGTSVFAWNGSPESSRSLAFALPLLARSESVHVLCVGSDESRMPNGADVVTYLAWHGIHARTDDVAVGDRSHGETLLEEVGRVGGDLLVMGAYTHSRFRQLIFGGVTRTVLDHATIPVFMAH